MNIALIDNYDSFTYNLFDYVSRTNVACTVFRNDSPSLCKLKDFDALILSPGPQRPENAGRMMDIIDQFVTVKPILGVCLGHQALALHFGAKLEKANKPQHGKTSLITHDGKDLFQNIENPMQVMRYHSLIVKDLPDCLDCIAQTEEFEIMALKHKELAIWGVQFHPESILSTQGIVLIENWINIINNNHKPIL